MTQAFQVRTAPLYSGIKPVRDPQYARYVKQFPCVVCGKSRGAIDPAHIGPHGTGQKACDLTVIPECRKCHDTWGSKAPDGVDVPAIQRMLQRFYCLKNGNPAHWPNLPDLTRLACSKCQHEDFSEEFRVKGECPNCGSKIEEREAA